MANRKYRALEQLKALTKFSHVDEEPIPTNPRRRERSSTPQEQRVQDIVLMDQLNTFLHRGSKNKPRSLSPHRALQHLEDQDVRELLGKDKVEVYRRAAERLTQ